MRHPTTVGPTQSSDGNPAGRSRTLLGNATGFTLLELVLAALISSLVIGILSVSLTFALRTWERQQDRKESHMPRMLALLKWQLANFDPVPITSDGESKPLFIGDEASLTLATDASVKALSRGVPVVARYIYLPKDRKLYYAEIPLDPYHGETIQAFLELGPGKRASWPVFFSVDVAEFSLAYSGEEDASFANAWESQDALPRSVLVKWSPGDGAPPQAQLIAPNSLFPKKVPKTGLERQRDQFGGDAFD